MITLRETNADDLPVLFAHQADAESATMAAFPSREREAFDAHWAKVLATPDGFAHSIFLDGVLAGNVVSFVRDDRRYVGYWIGREFWGRGVATAGLAQFVERVVTERPLHAHVAVHNIGSIRVLAKCGFVVITDDAPAAPDDGVAEYLMCLT